MHCTSSVSSLTFDTCKHTKSLSKHTSTDMFLPPSPLPFSPTPTPSPIPSPTLLLPLFHTHSLSLSLPLRFPSFLYLSLPPLFIPHSLPISLLLHPPLHLFLPPSHVLPLPLPPSPTLPKFHQCRGSAGGWLLRHTHAKTPALGAPTGVAWVFSNMRSHSLLSGHPWNQVFGLVFWGNLLAFGGPCGGAG